MNIIIAGCGKVGRALAEQLSREKHDITVISQGSRKLFSRLQILQMCVELWGMVPALKFRWMLALIRQI